MRWTGQLLVAGSIACLFAPSLPAQAPTGVAFTPIAGYIVPGGEWTDNDTLRLEPKGGVFVGLTAELSLNKQLSVTASVIRTLGITQKLEASVPVFDPTEVLETDMATTQIAATLLFRPLGRLPSGAPKTVYLEVGAGLTLYSVSNGFEDPRDPDAFVDLGSTTPMLMAGAGLSFPVGPRSSVQFFGRLQYELSEYGSQFLDEFNATPPVTGIQGEKNLVFQFGVGLRVGR